MIATNLSDKELFDTVRRVAKVACAALKAYDMSDDLTQEVFLNMPTIQQKWDPDKGALDAYLYGYAINILRNMLAQESRLVSLDDEQGVSIEVDMADEQPDLDESLDVANALRRIEEKLAANGMKSVEFEYFERRNRTSCQHNPEPNVLDQMLARLPLSKAEVARRIGISPQLLNAYIKGKTKSVPREVIESILEIVHGYSSRGVS